jgi:2'-5' RNA ligase
VSEKKADKFRYWITYLVKDLEVDATFKPTERHLTIIPWFVTDKENAEVIKSFKEHFSGLKPFEITIGKNIEFKNGHKIPVNLVAANKKLEDLHKKGLDIFSALDARWAVKKPYAGEEYIPHIRRRVGHNFTEGETLEISSLSLISANRRGDEVRNVLAKVDLYEK